MVRRYIVAKQHIKSRCHLLASANATLLDGVQQETQLSQTGRA